MILGLGTDVVDLVGFREQLSDVASAFVRGTFTEQEQAASWSRPSGDPVPHLGARFAAKEAFVKAWSSARRGLPPVRSRLDLREVEVVNDTWGRPALCLHGDVALAVRGLGPVSMLLSMSHDGPVATATVLIASTAR